jgi:hypothetical protein
LQEVADGLLSRGVTDYPLDDIAKNLWYHVTHAKSYGCYDENKQYGSFGVAIMSRYPIRERQTHYVPYLGWYREFTSQEVGIHLRWKETTWKERLSIWTFERQAPSPVLDTQILVNDQVVRLLCTHFKPSQKCTESFQMLKHVQYLQELLGFYTDLPTILWWDFNIGKDAIVLQWLYEQMDHVLDVETNTLNTRIHPWFQHDIPETGYHVDHLLQKWFQTLSSQVDDTVDISDHFPVVAELA